MKSLFLLTPCGFIAEPGIDYHPSEHQHATLHEMEAAAYLGRKVPRHAKAFASGDKCNFTWLYLEGSCTPLVTSVTKPARVFGVRNNHEIVGNNKVVACRA